MAADQEQVLVIPRAEHFGGTWPQGFVPLESNAAERLLTEFARTARYVDRAPAEEDPSFKQPIPYCVLTAGDEVFVMRRKKRGTEGRLHGKYSVGIGGHVNPVDGPPDDPQTPVRGLGREVSEELDGLTPYLAEARLLGLLNHDSDPVGAVHVGLVYRLEMPAGAETETVKIREISKLSGGFRRLVEIQDLWQDPGRFESWSQIVLEAVLNLPSDGSKPHSSTKSSKGNVREEQYDGGTYPDTEP